MWIDDEYYTESQILNLIHVLKEEKLFYWELYLKCLELIRRNFEVMGDDKNTETTTELIRKVEELE